MESQVKVSPIAIVNLEDVDDDDTFITPMGSPMINAISAEQYSEDRDLHLSIMASLLPTPPPPVINLEKHYHYDHDDVQVLDIKPPSKKRNLPGRASVIEIGQSSNSKTRAPIRFMCEICFEPKPMSDSFKIEGCANFYCRDCMSKYIASKLDDNVSRILCPVPNCPGHDHHDDVQVLDIKPPSKKKNLPGRASVIEIGQSSNSKTRAPPRFMCEICFEPKPMSDSFKIEGCAHFYCTDCMSKCIASKLDDNVSRILCPVPNCPGHDYDDDDDVQVLDIKPPSKKKNLPGRASVIEIGQASNSKTQAPPRFRCEICVEPKPMSDSFKIEGCAHFYCRDCMSKYIASKLDDNVSRILCPVPNCRGLLEPEYCRWILPPELFDRWGNALCESVLLGSEKFYCPFKDCSALLINDGGGGGEVITQSECPYCRRLFCVQCKSPWHADIDCREFQKLHKDERGREDIMMMKLAKYKKWKRCPKCKFYVEKSYGCTYIKCRCGTAFCYNCGALNLAKNSHICHNCSTGCTIL